MFDIYKSKVLISIFDSNDIPSRRLFILTSKKTSGSWFFIPLLAFHLAVMIRAARALNTWAENTNDWSIQNRLRMKTVANHPFKLIGASVNQTKIRSFFFFSFSTISFSCRHYSFIRTKELIWTIVDESRCLLILSMNLNKVAFMLDNVLPHISKLS